MKCEANSITLGGKQRARHMLRMLPSSSWRVRDEQQARRGIISTEEHNTTRHILGKNCIL